MSRLLKVPTEATAPTREERFQAKVKVLSGGCHAWTGYRTTDGYGQFRVGEKVMYAHRFAFEQAQGLIPLRMHVDHICNVPFCVNVEHLQVVTPGQNNMLIRVRTGEAEIYVWEFLLDMGLAVELSDLRPDGRRANRALARSRWLLEGEKGAA